jgi:hypothetical protein
MSPRPIAPTALPVIVEDILMEAESDALKTTI